MQQDSCRSLSMTKSSNERAGPIEKRDARLRVDHGPGLRHLTVHSCRKEMNGLGLSRRGLGVRGGVDRKRTSLDCQCGACVYTFTKHASLDTAARGDCPPK